jgi:hypothetical protein
MPLLLSRKLTVSKQEVFIILTELEKSLLKLSSYHTEGQFLEARTSVSNRQNAVVFEMKKLLE